MATLRVVRRRLRHESPVSSSRRIVLRLPLTFSTVFCGIVPEIAAPLAQSSTPAVRISIVPTDPSNKWATDASKPGLDVVMSDSVCPLLLRMPASLWMTPLTSACYQIVTFVEYGGCYLLEAAAGSLKVHSR